MKEIYFISGTYRETNSKKGKGLNIRKVIRDTLRQCGYPCYNCEDQDCSDPDLTICDHIANCTGTGDVSITGTGNDLTIQDTTNSIAFDYGQFTPTVTHTDAGITAFTVVRCQYMKVGNVVTYSGNIIGSGTSTAANSFRIELPIPTTIGTGFATGTATVTESGTANPINEVSAIVGSSANQLVVYHDAIATPVVHFNVQYEIL